MWNPTHVEVTGIQSQILKKLFSDVNYLLKSILDLGLSIAVNVLMASIVAQEGCY